MKGNSNETPPANYQRVVFACIQAFLPRVSSPPVKRLQDLEAALPAGVFDGLIRSCASIPIEMVSPALQTALNLSISSSYQALHSRTILRVFLRLITFRHSEDLTGAFSPPLFSKSHCHCQCHNHQPQNHHQSHNHNRDHFQYHRKTCRCPILPHLLLH